MLLHKVPVTNVTVGVAILKRANGWKPFLYNISVDACKFLKARVKNPVALYMSSLFLSYTNFNHNCPFDVSERYNLANLNSI